uniref:hypothetical protein n=1 Tax=Pseudomonas viridiflava TaxID=33069 RepID=UPI00197FFEE3
LYTLVYDTHTFGSAASTFAGFKYLSKVYKLLYNEWLNTHCPFSVSADSPFFETLPARTRAAASR